MSEFRKVVKHMSIYSLGVLLGKVSSFLMLPLYTHVLSPADYGVIELLQLFGYTLAIVVGVGMASAVLRFYYVYHDPDRRHAVVSTGMAILAVLFAATVTLAMPFSKPLSQVIFGTAAYASLVRLELIVFALANFIEIPLAYVRAKQASVTFVAICTVRLVIELTLNVIMLVVLKLGVAGILYSSITTSMLVGGYLIMQTLRETGFRPSLAIGRQLVAFGLPLVLQGLGTFTINFSDRYFLRLFGTLDQVGMYSLAYKIAAIAAVLLADPFAQIWGPKFFEIANRPDGRRTCQAMFRHLNLVMIFAILGLSLFAPDVLQFMTAAPFRGAAAVVPVIGLSYLFASYRQFSYVGFWVKTETRPVARLTTLAAGVNLIGNVLLIPRFGMWGAAWATVVAYGVEFLVGIGMSQRRYRVDYPWTAIVAPLLGAAAMYVFVLLLASLVSGPALFAAKAIVLLLFPVLALAVGALSPLEFRTLVAFVHNPARAMRAIYAVSPQGVRT